ncbi:MAG: cytochrome-c peroxidase [Chlorobi bacterium]|nr:cytochrome-c peroxidase [Chlorobiota bacterium]
MKKIIFYLTVFLFVINSSCTQKSTTENTSDKPSGEDMKLIEKAKTIMPALPVVNITPKDEALITLGKSLYFDTRLSLNNTISCNSCHNLSTYGVDNNSLSFGVGGKLGVRNSPTVLNAFLHISQFWDGREPDVEAQAKGPVLNPVEMAMHDSIMVVDRISSIPGYNSTFEKTFGETGVTYDKIAKAIGAFERTLVTPSPYDEFINGNGNALTAAEKKGLETFINAGCITCHISTTIGGNMFQKFGLVKQPYWEYTKSEKIDNGRFDVTKNENDKYFFKVPSLRNIVHTYPYFHDGSVWDLKEAVKIMALLELGKELNNEETESIVTFLNALTGEIPKSALELPLLPVYQEKL